MSKYTETQILGTLLIAIREGVPTAARVTKVPQRTIYNWFDERGGLAEIRNYVNIRADHALSAASEAIANEVLRRAEGGKIADEDLMETFRTILGLKVKGDGAGADAAAQANAHVWNINVNE